MNIGFWKKETGNMLSHSAGLTPEQMRNIQALEPGDRLILWENHKRKDTDPDFTLTVYKPKEKYSPQVEKQEQKGSNI